MQQQQPQQTGAADIMRPDQVTMRPKKKSPSKRHGLYVDSEKPPLPPPPPCPEVPPRPPPRTRPKSWTSSLFNAMKPTHRSVTFQCVDENVQMVSLEDRQNSGNGNTPTSASGYCTLPSSRPSAVASTGVKQSSHSRTPSPFRSMVKGLFKGQSLLSAFSPNMSDEVLKK